MRRTDSRIVLGLHRSGHKRRLIEGALTLGVRALDTGYNYLGFTSHRTLARTVGDLLPEFTISTKVGFFPGARGVEHSLDPRRLRNAVEESADDLHRAPATVFVHNPERTLAGLTPEAGRDRLAAACAALEEAVGAGLCRTWGISSWDTRALLRVLDGATAGTLPVPDALMVRAGLLVGADVLDASEQVPAWFGLGVDARWGMSPFGGDAKNPVWDTVNVRAFLAPGQDCTNLQAAFCVAYALPHVGRIAVGTDNVDHLSDLVTALRLCVDENRITRYRQLLRAKAVTTPAR